MEEKIDLGKLIENHQHYSINQTDDQTALIFSWKHVLGLSVPDFRKGITVFASLCKTHQPISVIFDARKLERDGAALGWVSGRKKASGEEEYVAWWSREIVPIYHEAGISSLAVATGDPNAAGEVSKVPPGVKFKIGYFTDLESAVNWEIV